MWGSVSTGVSNVAYPSDQPNEMRTGFMCFSHHMDNGQGLMDNVCLYTSGFDVAVLRELEAVQQYTVVCRGVACFSLHASYRVEQCELGPHPPSALVLHQVAHRSLKQCHTMGMSKWQIVNCKSFEAEGRVGSAQTKNRVAKQVRRRLAAVSRGVGDLIVLRIKKTRLLSTEYLCDAYDKACDLAKQKVGRVSEQALLPKRLI
ncbi:hypothetical protein Efla_003736 [Eimeria flavescens]